jgi:hypothetical protein
LTDWSAPIDLDRGQRDADAYAVEPQVSVHDHGHWIVDRDILESLKKGSGLFNHEFFFKAGCYHIDDVVCEYCLDELREFNPELSAKALFVV